VIIELRAGIKRASGCARRTKFASHRAALLMILSTATRLNEVCGATWSEFNLDEEGGKPSWTIPGTRIKDSRGVAQKSRKKRPPHIIPLPRQTVEFLRSRRPQNWLPEQLVFPNEAGTVLNNWDKVTRHLFNVTGTSGWTRHDLRRTAATMMGEMGTPPHVIESVLNHATIHSSLADTYNRSRYLTEVGEALQKWADWIDGLVWGGEVPRGGHTGNIPSPAASNIATSRHRHAR
jgi:integrase